MGQTAANEVASPIDEIMWKIRLLVVDELELDLAPEELDEDAHFIDVYDADSLSLIQILARMDRELKLTIPQDQMANMSNLAAIRAFAVSRA
jgi:acyl carrier protein